MSPRNPSGGCLVRHTLPAEARLSASLGVCAAALPPILPQEMPAGAATPADMGARMSPGFSSQRAPRVVAPRCSGKRHLGAAPFRWCAVRPVGHPGDEIGADLPGFPGVRIGVGRIADHRVAPIRCRVARPTCPQRPCGIAPLSTPSCSARRALRRVVALSYRARRFRSYPLVWPMRDSIAQRSQTLGEARYARALLRSRNAKVSALRLECRTAQPVDSALAQQGPLAFCWRDGRSAVHLPPPRPSQIFDFPHCQSNTSLKATPDVLRS